MTDAAPLSHDGATARGIAFILAGMVAISINDMAVKSLSDAYPLHQIVFVRSAIALALMMVFLQFEGGFASLRTDRPGLHLLRGLLIVGANMTFFAALAAMPLAEATAIFFVAPLFITLLSIPILGERVGLHRVGAILVGFAGVLVIVLPGSQGLGDVPLAVLVLPVLAAALYAAMVVLTRLLGARSRASAMAVYIQSTFIGVSLGVWLAAGDGRFDPGPDQASLHFLLRAWVWPAPEDWGLFLAVGLMTGTMAYCISQAYRLGNAATISAYEYVALPLAVFWGWVVFGHLPGAWSALGIVLVLGSGIYVFWRERVRRRPLASGRPLRR